MNHQDESAHTFAHFDLDRGPRRAAVVLVVALAAFMLLAIIWMATAHMEISVQAPGRIIPSRRVQHIQSLEGGIIESIAVNEGDRVTKGAVLAVVANREFEANLAESRENYWGMRATVARLDAELAAHAPDFPADVREHAAQQVERERQLYAERRREHTAALEAARQLVAQRRQELEQVQSQLTFSRESLHLAEESLSMEQNLERHGAGARADLISARQQVTRLGGDVRTLELSQPRLQGAIREAESRLAEVDSKYRSDASTQRNELQVKVAALEERMHGQSDKVTRRTLRAPVDGVVNRVLLRTLGGVAKAGESVMELVPADDRLLIVGEIKPSDIAFLQPGQRAMVRISAYDSSIYGALEARVVQVGADVLNDERQQRQYYEVQMESDTNHLGRTEQNLPLRVGMSSDARIETGRRTVLEYLLKPIVKTFQNALQER